MRDAARHAVVLTLASALLAAPGCRVVRKWFAPAEQVELSDAPTIASESQLADPDARQGIEVRMLVVDDTDYDAPRALRPFVGEGVEHSVEASTREAWAAWGLRLIEVPVDQLDATLARMRVVRPISNQWLGEFGAWRAIIRSGENGSTRVRVGDSLRQIEAGRPRLIARSWSEPMLVEDGVRQVLRLDLGVQIEAKGDSQFLLLPDQRERTLDDQGQVIDELLSSITLRGDRALVIVGDEPGADWSGIPDPAPVIQTPAEDGEDEQSSGQPVSRAINEPRVPPVRSLGELMFVAPGSRMTRAGESRNIPKRVVVILVPSLRGDGPERSSGDTP